MKFELGFGTGTQKVEIPEKNLLAVLEPNKVETGLTGEDAVKEALKNPIGSKRLKEIVKPGEKIVIITSDITRPCPTWKIMPALLNELYDAGISKKDITLVFALGSHRKMTEEEQKHLAGEKAYNEIMCMDGDASDCVHLGVTKNGTPVDIVRTVAEADRRICLGNIEYHYFAGYSGGAKAIMPGVSTFDAIQSNHSMMVKEGAFAGNIEGNPVREDIEEAAALCRVDFIVNVVLDAHKEIIRAVAGDVTEAHRVGCRFLDSLYRIKIPHRADIVLVSQGGAPKDMNLYQTQKALDNAKHAVKKGGTIILIGACTEGLGQKTFEEWMQKAETPDDLIKWTREHFRLGGHKAAAIAMVEKNAEVDLVSEMPDDLVKTCFMHPFKDVQSAFDDAVKKYGSNAEVIVMPYGGSTLPSSES
jgi:nickel-dependent lactate racemase